MKATRGKFKLAGIVNGTTRETFFKEITFPTGSVKREVSFAVKTSGETEIWLKIDQFLPKDLKKAEVTFQKYDPKTKKNESEKVPYLKRKDFKKEGFRPQFGIELGLETEGKKVVKTSYFSLDAMEILQEKLKDGMEVYIEGDIDTTKYVNKTGEVSTYTNFKPTKISLATKEIDFEKENFVELNVFQQDILFMGVEKSEDKFGGKPKFVIEAKIIVNKKDEDKKPYDEVINVEYFTTDEGLAKTLKNPKNIKPYNKIQVLGKIINTVEEEIVTEVDAWGDGNVEFKTTGKPSKKEMQITTALPSTIDVESYTQELVESVVKTKQDFGKSESDNWGSGDKTEASTEEGGDDVW